MLLAVIVYSPLSCNTCISIRFHLTEFVTVRTQINHKKNLMCMLCSEIKLKKEKRKEKLFEIDKANE